MDISRDQDDYLEDDIFSSDDGDDDAGGLIDCLEQDANGVAWREIEKYRERRELERLIKDDFYEEPDINSVWE